MKNVIIDLGKFDIKAIIYDDNGEEISRHKIGSHFKPLASIPKYGKISETIIESTYSPLDGVFGMGENFIDPVETKYALGFVKSFCDRYLQGEEDVDITLLVPIGDYNLRTTLKESFQDNFGLEVTVLPQAAFLKKNGLVVDIGGGTTDYLIYKDGEIVDAGSFHLGMRNVLRELRDVINDKIGKDINMKNLRVMIINQKFEIDKKEVPVKEYLSRIIEDFWNSLNDQIMSRFKEYGQNVTIIGASVPLFKEFIEDNKYESNDNAFISIETTQEYLMEE